MGASPSCSFKSVNPGVPTAFDGVWLAIYNNTRSYHNTRSYRNLRKYHNTRSYLPADQGIYTYIEDTILGPTIGSPLAGRTSRFRVYSPGMEIG